MQLRAAALAQIATTPSFAPPAPDVRPEPSRHRGLRVLAWLLAAAAILGGATAIVVTSGMRPGYDAFGWLVWGKQVLHWNLNTDGAPSWKPLPFVFTLPYALAGRTQMVLWLVTAVAGALAAALFAGRIAYRLTRPCPGRPWAPWLAGAFAAAGVLSIAGYAHQVLIASSDPLVAALCLAAVDAHLGRRPRLAFAMLVLACLGRPEAWPFALLYAIWAWRAVPSLRVWSLLGLMLIPAFWFTVPGLTSKSWFTPGKLALTSINAVNVIHGNKVTGLLTRFAALHALPMRIAVAGAVVIGLARRDLRLLWAAAAAALWVAIELALVLHGWSGAPRYLFEPATLAVAVGGAALGRLLAYAPRRPLALRIGGPLVAGLLAAALVVSLVPTGRARVSDDRSELTLASQHGIQVDSLHSTVARIGGPRRIRACGQPTTLVGLQSMIAWEVGLNVGNVGFRPGRAIARGEAVVVLKPLGLGWQVRPFNTPPSHTASCASLRYPPPPTPLGGTRS